MIRVLAIYPNTPGKRFDADYYATKHIPLVLSKVGSACRQSGLMTGDASVMPPGAPSLRAMAWFDFDSAEAFQAAFGAHAAEILADTPNFTDMEPNIIFGEIRT